MEQIKRCNGFDSFCCYCCERFDKNTQGTLPKTLAIDPDTGKRTCNHWIKMSVNNPLNPELNEQNTQNKIKMAAIVETFITCDHTGCDATYGVDNRNKAAWEHRKQYWKDGWIFRNGKDYCPNCRDKKY